MAHRVKALRGEQPPPPDPTPSPPASSLYPFDSAPGKPLPHEELSKAHRKAFDNYLAHNAKEEANRGYTTNEPHEKLSPGDGGNDENDADTKAGSQLTSIGGTVVNVDRGFQEVVEKQGKDSLNTAARPGNYITYLPHYIYPEGEKSKDHYEKSILDPGEWICRGACLSVHRRIQLNPRRAFRLTGVGDGIDGFTKVLVCLQEDCQLIINPAKMERWSFGENGDSKGWQPFMVYQAAVKGEDFRWWICVHCKELGKEFPIYDGNNLSGMFPDTPSCLTCGTPREAPDQIALN